MTSAVPGSRLARWTPITKYFGELDSQEGFGQHYTVFPIRIDVVSEAQGAHFHREEVQQFALKKETFFHISVGRQRKMRPI